MPTTYTDESLRQRLGLLPSVSVVGVGTTRRTGRTWDRLLQVLLHVMNWSDKDNVCEVCFVAFDTRFAEQGIHQVAEWAEQLGARLVECKRGGIVLNLPSGAKARLEAASFAKTRDPQFGRGRKMHCVSDHYYPVRRSWIPR